MTAIVARDALRSRLAFINEGTALPEAFAFAEQAANQH
jgi:hypothetical protein